MSALPPVARRCWSLTATASWRRSCRHLSRSHGEQARTLIGRVALLGLVPPVLGRALEPFTVPVRTLDALHLASLDFLRGRGRRVELASYDDRLLSAAREVGSTLLALLAGGSGIVQLSRSLQ